MARKKRTNLYLSVAGLMIMVAAVSAISARDPSGVTLRVGMIMVVVGAALWLPWRQLVPAVLLAWLVPNLARSLIGDTAFGDANMLLELPGLAGIAFFTVMSREWLKRLEQEDQLIGTGSSELAGLNPDTGLYDENQLRPALSIELARSRRFGRTFALVLVGIEEMRQKFDYRDDAVWRASLDATTKLLRETRQNVDRVFHYKNGGFAMILPESTEQDIPGLVKRLRQLGRSMKPPEGEPGGPMPVHFGATFFPECATTVEDLVRRAEVALRIAAGNTTRYQLDSAEAPELPPVESMRRENVEAVAAPAEGLTQSPPLVTNPLAAAILDEAFAARAQEAESTQNPAPVLTEATSIVEGTSVSTKVEPVSAEIAPTKVSGAEPAGEAEAPTLSEMGAPVSEVEAPYLPKPLPVTASVAAPEAPAAASAPEPVLATATVAPAAEPIDDFEALLKQMDETLKMIKSVRSHAA
jgi:GGDEF domain-containing protein